MPPFAPLHQSLPQNQCYVATTKSQTGEGRQGAVLRMCVSNLPCRTRAVFDSECECAQGWGAGVGGPSGLPWKPAAPPTPPVPCQSHMKIVSMTESYCPGRPVGWKTLARELPVVIGGPVGGGCGNGALAPALVHPFPVGVLALLSLLLLLPLGQGLSMWFWLGPLWQVAARVAPPQEAGGGVAGLSLEPLDTIPADRTAPFSVERPFA